MDVGEHPKSLQLDWSDLADGHVKAMKYLDNNTGCFTVNLGAGKGHSVMEVIHAFAIACQHAIPFKVGSRRSGDLPAYFADSSLAKSMLDWESKYDLNVMCRDTWNWQVNNPNGYKDLL